VRTGTRTYVCGQRDLGNGYFEDIECTEPVYETRTRTETDEEPAYRSETHYETVTEREPVYREVAVYDTFYTYRVPRWTVVDTLKTRGDTVPPFWADTVVGRNRRIARRRDAYYITFRRQDDGSTLMARVPVLVWMRWRVGDRVGLRTVYDEGMQTHVLPADSLGDCRRWHLGRSRQPPGDSIGCSPPPDSTRRR
jgi:hypothetical protein